MMLPSASPLMVAATMFPNGTGRSSITRHAYERTANRRNDRIRMTTNQGPTVEKPSRRSAIDKPLCRACQIRRAAPAASSTKDTSTRARDPAGAFGSEDIGSKHMGSVFYNRPDDSGGIRD